MSVYESDDTGQVVCPIVNCGEYLFLQWTLGHDIFVPPHPGNVIYKVPDFTTASWEVVCPNGHVVDTANGEHESDEEWDLTGFLAHGTGQVDWHARYEQMDAAREGRA